MIPGEELCCRGCPGLSRPAVFADPNNAGTPPEPVCDYTDCRADAECLRELDAAIELYAKCLCEHLRITPMRHKLTVQDKVIDSLAETFAEIYADALVEDRVIGEELLAQKLLADLRFQRAAS